MTDPEPCGIKQEDTEQQIGWCIFLIVHQVSKTSSIKIIDVKLQVTAAYCFDDCMELRLIYSAWMNMMDCGVLALVVKGINSA